MKTLINFIVGTTAFLGIFVVSVGSLLALDFQGFVSPLVQLDGVSLAGLSGGDLVGALEDYEENLRARKQIVSLNGEQVELTLAELGISLDVSETIQRVERGLFAQEVFPALVLAEETLEETLTNVYQEKLVFPKNATLSISPAGAILFTPGASGDGIDAKTFKTDLSQRLMVKRSEPIELVVIQQAPAVQDNEVEVARTYATTLLRQGVELEWDEQTIALTPFTLRRLLSFVSVADPNDSENKILGVSLNQELLREYLVTTVGPLVFQPAIDARFTVTKTAGDSLGRVSQFAQPQPGYALEIDESMEQITEAVESGQLAAKLAVAVTQPDVATAEQAEVLGINTLLAAGVSDFVGSPNNRAHNIKVGTSKYHGLLLAPGDEFSFNQYLGPVDAAGGFKPELVIKKDKTVPEYGGGLCQVSTTAFRAALNAGLEITERRNHSYAVSYYGTPGFDATIYPGHTDLRFVNNTPGHILIQANVVGTKVNFEFWGTDDGREVAVSGPSPYGHQPDGAVKATLKQEVKDKDGSVLIDETFYSNYKSPKLYPKTENTISS